MKYKIPQWERSEIINAALYERPAWRGYAKITVTFIWARSRACVSYVSHWTGLEPLPLSFTVESQPYSCNRCSQLKANGYRPRLKTHVCSRLRRPCDRQDV
ncbi:hypothetical protein EVAR_79763_1 [Eumeta japonica]|uniref:Uncharacterized protein n=1 Tax=Eumeta variegata TaxID=151549 RepID=A0A4C1TAD2_EUMVA|nr:hypothetical protein EVAR_79763_1 [Eumeta japonica]